MQLFNLYFFSFSRDCRLPKENDERKDDDEELDRRGRSNFDGRHVAAAAWLRRGALHRVGRHGGAARDGGGAHRHAERLH